VVIDIGDNYISLQQLADSVARGKKLVNIVAELAIQIMVEENKNPRKYIMSHLTSYFLFSISWFLSYLGIFFNRKAFFLNLCRFAFFFAKVPDRLGVQPKRCYKMLHNTRR
jgi:hypothetical protein